MKKRLTGGFCFLIIYLLPFYSCTKLDTKVYDRVKDFWQTPEQIAAGVAPAYAGLRNYAPLNGAFGPGVYPLVELSTDEMIMPTRGGNWSDGGIWEEIWKHQWTPFNPFVQNGWAFIYGGVTRVNQILQAVEMLNPRPPGYVPIIAELKTIRAFYNFLALDLYGNVPIVDGNNINLNEVRQKTRDEVFAYIEKELRENLSALTEDVSTATYGRATKWFAQALLAKLYLNASVYTGAPKWTECIEACDAVLNSNKYTLEPDFFNNFLVNNEDSKENIFVIPFDIKAGLDPFWMQGATLHYNSNETFGLQSGGANGLCSTTDFYNLFDPNDRRKKIFLVGQQYKNQVASPANLQYDNNGNLLNFDPVISSFSILPPKAETAGARCAKWEFNKDGGGNMSNDFAVIRLADIVLMKAEAQFRNGNSAGALSTINQIRNGVSIRSRAGLPDFNDSEMNPAGLLKERGNELSWEGWRRNDMIRFGHFTDARNPEKSISENSRLLYPIPKAELDKNPFLVQNPGY